MVRDNKVGGILASIQVHENVKKEKKKKFTKQYFTRKSAPSVSNVAS